MMNPLGVMVAAAHLEDLRREAAQSRAVAEARRAGQALEARNRRPAAPIRAFWQVRRALGAR
jgi:hypothetical protein